MTFLHCVSWYMFHNVEIKEFSVTQILREINFFFSEPYSKKVFIEVPTSHKANIFSAKFLPCSNTRKIVSCAGDGNILFTGEFVYIYSSWLLTISFHEIFYFFADLARVGETHNNNFTCHSGTTYELQTGMFTHSTMLQKLSKCEVKA